MKEFMVPKSNRAKFRMLFAMPPFALALIAVLSSRALVGPCDAPVNPIVCENSKPGNPSSEWDMSRSGGVTRDTKNEARLDRGRSAECGGLAFPRGDAS
jgi:hypothetical protein